MRKYYIKATLKGGKSAADYEPVIHYKAGWNEHPDPDRDSKEECGRGIHLAIDIETSKRYVCGQQYYLATEWGNVLGEGIDKIRVDKCYLIPIPLNLLEAYEKAIAPAWETYLKVRAPAREAYEKAIAPAWEAYEKVRAPAREAYEKAIAPAWETYQAWEAYEKAEAQAREAYEKADAPAWETYEKAIAQAREAYEKVRAQAHRKLIKQTLKENNGTAIQKENTDRGKH